jgi:redox-regulated HSP33 family molecular chaperone
MLSLGRIIAVAIAAMLAQAAQAAETVTYTYDTLGRLTNVVRSGGINNGVSATYSYDKADNRSNVTVNAPPVYIVVPLNGYTLIKIR